MMTSAEQNRGKSEWEELHTHTHTLTHTHTHTHTVYSSSARRCVIHASSCVIDATLETSYKNTLDSLINPVYYFSTSQDL